MHAQTSQRLADERDDKRTQRALLAFVLHEFPAQRTRQELLYRGFEADDGLGEAIAMLVTVGLLWCEGDVVLPTISARHFDWLELP